MPLGEALEGVAGQANGRSGAGWARWPAGLQRWWQCSCGWLAWLPGMEPPCLGKPSGSSAHRQGSELTALCLCFSASRQRPSLCPLQPLPPRLRLLHSTFRHFVEVRVRWRWRELGTHPHFVPGATCSPSTHHTMPLQERDPCTSNMWSLTLNTFS